MEEVGHPREGQEEDLGPHWEWLEGVRRHWGLPHKEGGTVHDARAPAIRDGA